VAEIVNRHVKLPIEGIDRIYLNVYMPRLQYEQGLSDSSVRIAGQPLSSAALMSPMTRDFVMKLKTLRPGTGLQWCRSARSAHSRTSVAL
jgi:hypothetical protein